MLAWRKNILFWCACTRPWGSKVHVNMRETVLPPDLFGKHAEGAW
jgi:hypothetical protein